MEIKLFKKPKNPIMINGFPGFGLVGTIATEFLINHLKTEIIGKIMVDDLPAMVAIHETKLVDPISIHYNSEYNIVIVHAIAPVNGIEWEISKAILEIAKELGAKEIINLEGVGSMVETNEPRTFFYSANDKKSEAFKKSGIDPLKEGIIMGVTGALLVEAGDDVMTTAVFAETHTNLPDSKAAARIIEVLDKYLGLKIDYQPLLEQAVKFESKLKKIMQSSQEATDMSEKKKMSYVG